MSGLMKNGCLLLVEGGILVRVECVVLGEMRFVWECGIDELGVKERGEER